MEKFLNRKTKHDKIFQNALAKYFKWELIIYWGINLIKTLAMLFLSLHPYEVFFMITFHQIKGGKYVSMLEIRCFSLHWLYILWMSSNVLQNCLAHYSSQKLQVTLPDYKQHPFTLKILQLEYALSNYSTFFCKTTSQLFQFLFNCQVFIMI